MLVPRSCTCIVVGAAALTVTASVFGAEAKARVADLSLSIEQVQGITVDEIVTLHVDLTPNRPLSVVVPINGIDATLDLTPYDVRADGYELLVQGADGSINPAQPGVVNTLRGVISEIPGSVVAGSVEQDGFHAMIILPDGDRMWVNPVNPTLAGALPNDYMVYQADAVNLEGWSCGLDSKIVNPDIIGDVDVPDFEGMIAGPVCVAELGCDADVEYFNTYGTVAATEARIMSVVNTVNLQYQAQVAITHTITGIIVRTAEPDPYSQFNSTDLLCEFITEWTNNVNIPRDVAHLFTGREVNGGTIGQAADIGVTGICVNQGSCVGGQFGTQGSYCFSQSDFNGDFGCATDLTAHELGHLWGAFHCNCAGNTMNPFITCANNFTAASINSIIAYRDTRTCLDGACGGGEPTGACCFPDFSCADGLTQGDCAKSGGAYQGDFTNCADVNCGGPGGCGDPNAGDCFIANGTPFCDDFDCCQLVCAADPFCCDTEWDQICADAAIANCGGNPFGACCLPDGTCVDGVSEIECLKGLGGFYQGDGSNCGGVKCPQPITGACCLDDGSCIEVSPNDCGGDYQGDGTSCADVNCDLTKCTGDFNDDGEVGIKDLLFLLAAWGVCDTDDCDPQVCGTYTFDCNPDNPSCVCFTLFDGSPYCGPGGPCDMECAPDGSCPPGFVCQIETCCGVPICAADTGCDSPLAGPDFEFGELTTLGIAGIDFQIDGNPTEANDNPDCPGDLTGDNEVGINDLLILLGAWGPCPSQCGNPNAGNCYVANGTPYCNNADCCELVCASDPFCCDTEWDGICANSALEMCSGVETCANPNNGCGAELCGEGGQGGPGGSCFCFHVYENDTTGVCIDDFFCADVVACDAQLNCPPGFLCVTNSCCGEAFCAPAVNTCSDVNDCEPQVCGTYTFDCNPDNASCVCFTLFDGSPYCGPGGPCDMECAPDGSCPPGFVCQIETCCGVPICAADTGCESPLNGPSFEFGELTTLGIAGVDFDIVDTAQAVGLPKLPKPKKTGLMGSGRFIE